MGEHWIITCLRGIIRGVERDGGPCWRCEDHGCITIYSTSDEYAAPCPVCKGEEAYHAKIMAKEGELPASLRWQHPLPERRPHA